VVDLGDGGVRRVDDAAGPVGFTPDGSTIVSYRYIPDEEASGSGSIFSIPALVLLDAETLEETEVELSSLDWGPEFFVTRGANVVVITSPLGSSHIVVHDIDTGTTTELATPDGPTLREFVSRDRAAELWLADGGLYRIEYTTPLFEEVDLDFAPEHINLLPRSDTLVLDDPSTVQIVYLDPDSRSVVSEVMLPTPGR
jgi:hypothetical protein